ncbi:unnamed protein product [Lepeophtheirus salmonis]|uniref:(salmon louse) hypothetical protein n=1 Tax=Lepeophtheirus salmonis TaxID=72036 RepID=A0A7R8H1M3_LEPSM|nr:unnamed protein product [Lepeophtheirus salmonis]CAF2814826.1 unnamed protein product [Lepeophtheirus salmonis]
MEFPFCYGKCKRIEMESYAIQIPVQPSRQQLKIYLASETEFFALQFIKIPTQRNSALAERLLREVPGAQVVESSFSKMGWSFHYQEEWEGQGLGVGTTSPLESESEEGNSLDKSTKRLKKMLKNVDEMLELEKNKWSGSTFPAKRSMDAQNVSSQEVESKGISSYLSFLFIILAFILILVIAKLTFHDHNAIL